MEIKELLDLMVQGSASDLHLMVGVAPMVRIDGNLRAVTGVEPLTAEAVQSLVLNLVSPEQKEMLLTNREIDFSYQFGGIRFRVNAYHEKGCLAAALRLIPEKIRAIEDLKLPQVCHKFAKLRRGFVLVTGPTGHGKSTTLAAVIEEINQTRAEHVVTIEDPIEFVYKPRKSIISQREVHSDTLSWQVALKSVLREDPDVVLIGEMRDYETIASALTIAETGHLVFATLHTNSASQTVDRIIDVFPEHQQAQVRMQLAATLEAVLAQKLISSTNGGRVPATEILLATPAVRNTIREGKTHQIDNIIQTSGELGMSTLETSLAYWVKSGAISIEEAQGHALRPEELVRMVKGGA